ncbi:MAG: carboxypeptidase M32 [Bacteroidia bacterium]
MQKIADVAYASAVLGWDQETYMPEKGADFRAQQLSTLAGIAHRMFTEDQLGELIHTLSSDKKLDAKQAKNVELVMEEYDKQKKYSTEFVEEMSMCVSQCFQAWQTAKEKNDFSLYAPQLKKLVALKRKECEILGYKDHPYNALLNQYEKGTTTAEVETLFEEVKKELVPFVKKIAEVKQVSDHFFYQEFDKDKQWNFGIDLLKQMGYDFAAGRQDISSHPFTTNFNPCDVRVTTRVNEHDFSEMIWSCIHEGGHGLYEQGLPPEEYGLPLAEAISLGIHESQSRLWENNVGRSLVYWNNNIHLAKKYFPGQLKNVSAKDFYHAMNKVEPSLIRTNADELTYHFHILIRFEIEKALIEGSIEVEQLPELWNAKYKSYLGIDVPDFTRGVLQDIHWSHGSFGYFPTYSIGSFYAAQFFAQAEKDIPELKQHIEKGELKPLLNWLREKIHKHGKFYTASELCEKITGEKLNFRYFMDYAKNKFGIIYDLG